MHDPNPGDPIFSQDVDLATDGDVNELGLMEALSQSEIEDLLYSGALPAAERLNRLRQVHAQLLERRASEIGGSDADDLLGEVARALEELGGSLGERDEAPEDYLPLDAAFDTDDGAHIETLSPDDDRRYAAEGEDGEDVFVSEEEALGEDDEDAPP